MNRLKELHQEALKNIDAGDLDGAKRLAYEILSLGPHYLVSYVASGLLIVIGSAIGNEQMVREGTNLLQKDLSSIVSYNRYAPTAYYNLANGFYALFELKHVRDPLYFCFRETELDKAKSYYRKALEYDVQDTSLASKIWVNLGNCFDHLGRVIDALECYERALELKPDHGMALGNKGMAMMGYARITGDHQGTFLREAHSLLSRALKAGIPPEAEGSFSSHLNAIRKTLEDKDLGTARYPGYKIEAQSELEKFS